MNPDAKKLSPPLCARTAGVPYLVIIVAGIFAEAFVRGKLIKSGDASTTGWPIAGRRLPACRRLPDFIYRMRRNGPGNARPMRFWRPRADPFSRGSFADFFRTRVRAATI